MKEEEGRRRSVHSSHPQSKSRGSGMRRSGFCHQKFHVSPEMHQHISLVVWVGIACEQLEVNTKHKVEPRLQLNTSQGRWWRAKVEPR